MAKKESGESMLGRVIKPGFRSHHKSHAPNGPHGRAAVHALGRTKTTGNFAKIEKAEGKGAAIGAYQNALAKHQGRPAPFVRHAKHIVKQMDKHMKAIHQHHKSLMEWAKEEEKEHRGGAEMKEHEKVACKRCGKSHHKGHPHLK